MRIKDQQGFTIAELLIALIIISVVAGASTITFTTVQNINKKALDVSAANSLAFAKIQEYENKSFANISTTSPTGTLVEVEDFSASLPTNFEKPRTAKVYVNTVSSTLKQVVVSVKFGSGNTQRDIEYANFIQKNGLGR